MVFAFFASTPKSEYPIIVPDSMMNAGNHGTCMASVQHNLRFGIDNDLSDRICCFNRHYAENSNYSFNSNITWIKELSELATT